MPAPKVDHIQNIAKFAAHNSIYSTSVATPMILMYRDQLINLSLYVGFLALTLSPICSTLHDDDVAHLFAQATIPGAFRLIGAILLLLCIKGECRYMWLRRNMPPTNALGYSYPLIGHLYDLATRHTRDFLVDCTDHANQKPYVLNLLMMPTVCYYSADDTTWAYTQEGKGKMVPMSIEHQKQLVGVESVIAQCGKQHKRLRKLMHSSFSSAAMKDYLPVMDDAVKKSLALWNRQAMGNGSKSEAGWQTLVSVRALSLEILFRSAFPDIDRSELRDLQRDVDEWMLGIGAIVPLRIPGLTYNTALLGKERLYRRVKGLLAEFKSKHSPDDKDMKNSLMGRLCYSTDDEGNPLNDVELVENFSLLILAGDDTTSGSTGNVLYHWDRLDPELQQSMRDEANSLPTELEYSQLQTDLPLLSAFLAELWRLETPVQFHPTSVKFPVTRDGYTIPEGAGINIMLDSGHYENDRFPNCNEFDLRRFLPRDHPLVVHDPSTCCTGDVNPNSLNSKYRTFNNGMHSCIGHLVAKLQIRVLMIRFLQSYNVELRNVRRVHWPLGHWSSEFQFTKRTSDGIVSN